MSEEETLLEFPCQFPIKAMGKNSPDFERIVFEIVSKHVEGIQQTAFSSRLSKESKYISVTATIVATSKKQLDNIYQDLTACSEVLMSL